MYFEMDISSALKYNSKSQKARYLTEGWVHKNISCPGCGVSFEKCINNSPVADFYCLTCLEDFELKATSGKIGKIIPDGAYRTMIERLSSNSNPNLLLLEYNIEHWSVQNLAVIPKYYFTPSIIQKRTPLSSTAQRAGWVGCNILIGEIPVAGKIHIIRNQSIQPLEKIITAWRKTSFLKEITNNQSKGWLLQTMLCIDRIGKQEFDLKDIYKFEKNLRTIFPDNNHIKEKLRQQLQILRDRGYLNFIGGGVYALK